MPKIIEDGRGRILAAVRDHIEAEGWDALALRTIAARAGIAQGTIYNYFASREEIAFTLIGEDRSALMARIASLSEEGHGAQAALSLLFSELKTFMGVYRRIWEEGGFATVPQGRHYHQEGMKATEEGILALVAQIISGRRVRPGLDPGFVLDLIGHAFIRLSRGSQVSCEDLFPVIDRLLEAEPPAPKDVPK